MYKFLLYAVSALFTVSVSAQKVAGVVKDEQGKALHGASVTLKSAKDSSTIKYGASSASGTYEFTGIRSGKYFVYSTFVGYASKGSPAVEVNGANAVIVPDIILNKTSGNLKEVLVNGQKPVVEVQADKTVLNVEGSVNAVGQDALELLRKSPGVMVDKDDNLSLSGKNGVKVYIDGRPSPLSGADLAAYLKTLQSSSVEAIEIITNPSAKYDAAGNAGIINIRLKKNKSFGTNGSVNAGYSIGTFPKYNGGFSINNRNKRVNLFANYNYNQGRYANFMDLNRQLLDTLFMQRSNMEFRNKSHNFKAGMDYFINKKSTVGVMADGNLSDNTFTNLSRTPISYVPTGKVNRVLVADNTSKSKRRNVNANLNYRYADTSGRELNIDADYGMYRITSDQYQPNYYFDPAGIVLQDSRVYNMLAPTDIDIYSLKTDYQQKFKKGILGFGGKVSYVNTANNFERYDVAANLKTLDTLRSNRFDYKENINALYVNYNKAYKKITFQVGVRMESTHTEGRSKGFQQVGTQYMSYDSTFNRNYTDFFPSAAITYSIKPTNQFGLRYSRRIDRPAYQDLNPFEFKLDEYTFQKGNTQLRPQYTNSFAITHTYKYKLNTTLNYSHVKDVFTQLVDTAERSKAFLTKKNLATQDITSLNISYPYQHKWYSVFTNFNGYYSHYKANFGTGRIIDLDVFAFNVYQQHTFTLSKKWKGELSGFYNSPSLWQGTFKSKAMYGVDAGVLKTILKDKGNLKVSVSDIFNTMRWSATSNFAGQMLNMRGGWESRQLKVNFTYRFGSNQVKAARQHKSGLEDENKRVGSQGGGIGN